MFTKGSDDKPRPVAGPSVLSSDLEITGKVSSVGAIDIGGRIKGEVHGLSLTLGADGHVSGKMTAGSAEILGEVEGDIIADVLTLRSSARARISAVCKTLVIESGAHVDGTFRRPEPPKPLSEPKKAAIQPELLVEAPADLPPEAPAGP